MDVARCFEQFRRLLERARHPDDDAGELALSDRTGEWDGFGHQNLR